jgi:hypothetical protein
MTRLFTSAGVGMLTLLLGAPAALYAQDEPKPPKQEEPKAEPRPEPRQQEANPPREREEARPKEEAKPPKHEDAKHQGQEGKQQERSENGRIARPAGKTVRIPDNKFRAQFGRSHTFVVNRPVVVEEQPRFQYAGYWFVIAEPWPVDWAYTDDCYIDYLDGDYFLFDLLHPGVRVVLFVVEA